MTEPPDPNSNPYLSAGQAPSSGVAETVNKQPPPRVWTVLLTLFVGLIASSIASAIIVVILAASQISAGVDAQDVAAELPKTMMRPPMFIGMIVLSQLALGLVVFVSAGLSPIPFFERLGMRRSRVGLSTYPVFMVGSLLPLALGIGAAHWVAKVIPADGSAQMLYEQMTTAWAIPFIILIGLLPGLTEEFLFRGYVQQRFLKRWTPAAGILLTSIIFGLFHVTPHAIAMATILGLWLGVVAWRSDSVWPTVFCHAFVNSTWNIWQVGQRIWGMPANPPLVVKLTIGLVIVACFLISLRLIIRAGSKATNSDVAAVPGGVIS